MKIAFENYSTTYISDLLTPHCFSEDFIYELKLQTCVSNNCLDVCLFFPSFFFFHSRDKGHFKKVVQELKKKKCSTKLAITMETGIAPTKGLVLGRASDCGPPEALGEMGSGWASLD